MSRGPRLRVLLLGANAVVLSAPLFALFGLHVYETYLVRQTERVLIAQSVAIGEMWRELWLEELGPGPAPPPEPRPPGRAGDVFVPIEPVVDVGDGIAPPQPPELPKAETTDTPARRAARRLTPILERMQVFNLSAVRLLDARGCVLATTRSEIDVCMDSLPEVASALKGRYSAIARRRVSDEPLPPLSDVRSRGAIRIFTALPVFSGGRVIGVVRMSRTSLDALTSLWHNRRGLVATVAAALTVVLLVGFVFSRLVDRPVQAITRRANAIAEGLAAPPVPVSALTPREVRAMSDALTVMTSRLQARAAYVAELAANVSHELKGPITAIRGAAELLRDAPEMDAGQRQLFVRNIDHDAARMERLVTRLLQLARIENAPEPRAEVRPRDFFTALAERWGEAVAFRVDDPPERVVVDPDHLASAVTNLLDNAVRHGAPHPVEVRVSGEGDRLRVDVRDRGPGISPANRARLFQRFFTTERDAGGTGLGLAIVKAVADRHGGSVAFTTGSNGTTFTLRL